MVKLHIIYIPGLGDKSIETQAKAVAFWRHYGVTAETYYSNWSTGTWEQKQQDILKLIDIATAAGKKVGLVGASAGAGAVVNLLAARQDTLVGAVLIAGKVNNPQTIGGGYRSKNAAFITSANLVPAALESIRMQDRARIMSRHAYLDEVVPRKDSFIPGAVNTAVPSAGHILTIATQITLGAPFIIRFLKKVAKDS